MSCIERCPHFRGKFIFGTHQSVLDTEVSLFQECPLSCMSVMASGEAKYMCICCAGEYFRIIKMKIVSRLASYPGAQTWPGYEAISRCEPEACLASRQVQ